MTNTSYITTTIPYVNAKPHIGFALELVQADVIARHKRKNGLSVRFQTGSDENSLKNVSAAEAAGRPVDTFVADNAARFLELQDRLNISADDFIRTSSDARHRPAVEKLWNACLAKGDLYQKSYTGLYCQGCEQFYTTDELLSGCCPEHGVSPDEVTETNWFFRLSRYQDTLRTAIETDIIEIVPATRKNEVLSLIRSGLQDFSVSRSSQRARGWGIPVPNDPEQTIYVWFDALGNYISALGYGDKNGSDLIDTFWLKAGQREHVVGKGVTRFHAVYWPAILLSAELPTPTKIYVHGYVTVGGRKIGKSNGNAIDPVPLIEQYGADAIRYYLLRHIHPTDDGDFTIERLDQCYKSELAGQLGNLVHRVLSIVKARGLPFNPAVNDVDASTVTQLGGEVKIALDGAQFNDALSAILVLVAYANKSVVERAPWILGKAFDLSQSPADQLALCEALDALGGLIVSVSGLLEVLLPTTAAAIAEQVGAISKFGKNYEGARPIFPPILPQAEIAKGV